MSRAVGQYMVIIREQREILNAWTDYEIDILDQISARLVESFIDAHDGEKQPDPTHVRVYAQQQYVGRMNQYHANLDIAEKRLKIAAAIGGVVDVSDQPVGHDIRIVAKPVITEVPLADTQRARDNLLAMDFFDRLDRMPSEGCHASKLTIPRLPKPDPALGGSANADAFQSPTYQSVVLGSFEDKAEAIMYRLAVQ